MSIQFKTTENLVSNAVFYPLVSEDSLVLLQEKLYKKIGVSNEAEFRKAGKVFVQMADALNLVKSLPLVPFDHCEVTYRTHEVFNLSHQSKTDDLRVFASVGSQRFSSEANLTAHPASESDWENTVKNLSEIRKGLKKIHDLLGSADSDLAFSSIEKAYRIERRLNKDLSILGGPASDLKTTFIKNDSVALFVARKDWYSKQMQEGFLGAKNDVVPLCRARLFDSEKAAQSFINRNSVKHMFSSFQVVGVNLNITDLGSSIKGQANSSNSHDPQIIYDVVAMMQKEQIEEALKQVSREKLLKRLEEMEGEEAFKEPHRPAQKKRSM